MSDAASQIQSARDLFAGGDAQGAYRALSLVFGSGPDPLAGDGVLAAAIALLADVARSFGDAALAEKLGACRARPDDPQALFDIAYSLYEQRQFAAAGALLYRANALAPRQRAIVAELVGCLEHQLRYGEGALVVDASGLATTEPVCAYLSGFCWMMTGDLDVPRQRVRALATVTDPTLVFMREMLEGMLARADALLGAGIALDDRALTAWQAVLDGTVLLHCSPHGHPDPMRGRYAFVGDSPGLEREGLERLRALLVARGAPPARIVCAPDRASRILAIAASALFGVPRADWTAADTASALVIAWSMEAVEDAAFLQAMHDHRPGQVLFVHASSWTEPFAYAPDVTTFLHQAVTCPWTGGAMRMDPDTRQVVRAPPDGRDDDAIAKEILGANIGDPSASSFEEVLAVARALDRAPPDRRGGLSRASGKRLHQRAGGPVPSNRFL